MPAFLSHAPASDPAFGADILVVPVGTPAQDLYERLARVGKGVATAALRALDLGDFLPKAGSRLVVHSRGVERFPRFLLLGLGDEGDRTPVALRRAFSSVARDPLFERIDSVAVHCGPAMGSGPELARSVAAAVDGLLEGTYRWTTATESHSSAPGRFVFLGETPRSEPRIREGLERGKAIGAAVSLARDLGNTPANRMSPADLADRARDIAKSAGLKARVLDGAALARERLEALRVVGGGSSRGPRLVVLEYDASRGGAPVALVGKGLVFDTGGLNIKPGGSMGEMKFDKCGACVVLAVMQGIAALELPVRVVAVVPAAENSISGDSYRPGDVIGSRSGKGIEVLNTDAEGRLVLADALDYAITEYAPAAVIDVATLTGAAYHALGDRACALLGTHEGLVRLLLDAGERVGERAWELPLWDEYLDDVKSASADVRNTGAWGAGTIAGAAFLRAFVGGSPWAHLDIAGVSRNRRSPKEGATGFGVRLLLEALRSWPPPGVRARARAAGRASRAETKGGGRKRSRGARAR